MANENWNLGKNYYGKKGLGGEANKGVYANLHIATVLNFVSLGKTPIK